jgi:hypothetical protein
MGTVIKMYAAGTGGTQDALATIDVPMPGHVVGLDWAVYASLATDFLLTAQLSFRSASAFATNDDRGIISEIKVGLEITTTGSVAPVWNKYLELPDLAIMGGERLYLHLKATASTVSEIVALIHFDFDLDKISTRRR